MGDPAVSAVVVTYGDRAPLLAASVRASLEAGCDFCVIVSNGSSDNTREVISRLEREFGDRLSVVHLPQNVGSQVAMRRGLRAALDAEISFALLLDDDNVISRADIDHLLRVAARDGSQWCVAVARRDQSRPHKLLSEGIAAAEVIPVRSSYQGFDVLTYLKKRLRAPKRSTGRITVPYSAYGGLMLPRDAIARILDTAFPDYVLYEDDTLTTAALSEAGWDLTFCPEAVVRDIDEKWYGDSEGAGDRWERLLSSDSRFRLFYAVRNRAHFDLHHYRGGVLRYHLNKFAFLMMLRMRKTRASAANYRLIRLALTAGERGQLGLDERYPLP